MQFITTKYTGKSEACPDETTGIATSHLTDKTTGRTTSHLTNPAKDAGQVIGYSHSTRLSAEELLMELLAIPLGCQRTTAKWLVMAGHPKGFA
jgi:hypothetical protein